MCGVERMGEGRDSSREVEEEEKMELTKCRKWLNMQKGARIAAMSKKGTDPMATDATKRPAEQ